MLALAFIDASIKDDVVAGIITEQIVGVVAQTAAIEEELLVVVRIGFGSWQRRGLTDYLVEVREDHPY